MLVVDYTETTSYISSHVRLWQKNSFIRFNAKKMPQWTLSPHFSKELQFSGSPAEGRPNPCSSQQRHKEASWLTFCLLCFFFCGDNWWFCLAGLMRDCLCNHSSTTPSEWQVGLWFSRGREAGGHWVCGEDCIMWENYVKTIICGWILQSSCAHMNFTCVHSVCRGDVEVLVPGMQKYKEGNKPAVLGFTSSQRDTETECVCVCQVGVQCSIRGVLDCGHR